MNKHITEKLENDEIVYAINVFTIQRIAKERIGRELDFGEMTSVKKGIEWGLLEWDDVVKTAIDNAVQHSVNNK
jgi:hypothetical protein